MIEIARRKKIVLGIEESNELIVKAANNATDLEYKVFSISSHIDLIVVEDSDGDQLDGSIEYYANFKWCPMCDHSMGDAPYCPSCGKVDGAEKRYYKKGVIVPT